jgi:CMP-N,N'-diacetyllegionaminic acid synthase
MGPSRGKSQMKLESPNVAVIPARGGSKGLPQKNIRPFLGKPLIAWTIQHALTAEHIDRVLVSTDCEEIASVAEHYGAEVLGLRPKKMSTDTASTEEVLLYVCSQLVSKQYNPKTITLLQCTSPIRLPGTLDRAIIEFYKTGSDSLLSVSKSHRFFWYNKNVPRATYNYTKRPRRQDLLAPEVPYIETGSIYITDFQKLLEFKNRLVGRICMFETDNCESFEIDTLHDFELCEYLAQQIASYRF